MNFDVKKLLPYFATAMITLFICWLLWANDKDEKPSGRNYEKEYKQSQEIIDRLRMDSLEMRQDLKSDLHELQEENLDLKIKLRQLEKHYEKLNFKAHTFDELDSIRDRTLSDLRKE